MTPCASRNVRPKTHSFCGTPARNTEPQPNHKETPTNSILEGGLPNKLPYAL